MLTYTTKERNRVIRDYFGPEGRDGHVACPRCGEPLRFIADYRPASGLIEVAVECAHCSRRFQWVQDRPEEPFKDLHISYFLERFRAGEPLRCPVDDSYVVAIEFNDRVLEFRCPFCNRRGRAEASPGSQ